ncbi:MAG: hypothetical protein ABIG63_12345 [Chloroflexota bacterium]
MKNHMRASFGITALFMVSIFWSISEAVAQKVAGGSEQNSLSTEQYPLRAAISVAPSGMR